MQQYIDRFAAYLKYQRNVSAHTLRNYTSDLAQFHDYLCPRDSTGGRRDIDIQQIDHITIREYMAKLYDDRRKKSSIARKLNASDVFKFLCREQIIDKPRGWFQAHDWKRGFQR
jgi:integrase/recombinase XerC